MMMKTHTNDTYTSCWRRIIRTGSGRGRGRGRGRMIIVIRILLLLVVCLVFLQLKLGLGSFIQQPDRYSVDEGLVELVDVPNRNTNTHINTNDASKNKRQQLTTIRSRVPEGLQWSNGCLSRTAAAATSTSIHNHSSQSPQQSQLPPKGIVVTMALAPKHRQHLSQGRIQICSNLPNQWEKFLLGQNASIDMLLVIQEEDKRWNKKRFINCMNISSGGKLHYYDNSNDNSNKQNGMNPYVWNNLDGTQLTTYEYHYHYNQQPATSTTTNNRNETQSSSSFIRIYIATTIVKYPQYIQQNPHLLKPNNNHFQNNQQQIYNTTTTMTMTTITNQSTKNNENIDLDPGCSARLRYIQGIRWYTREMLHLGILQQYDYFIKLDTDIIFYESPSFHLLYDMTQKNAMFAHTAEYHPKGDGSCSRGILHAVHDFINDSKNKTTTTTTTTTTPQNNRHRHHPPYYYYPWKNEICSNQSPEVQRNTDQYYTNLIIGRVSYFTSPPVLDFANYLNEYPQGFFQRKWTDQVFWQFALGLFLDTDFTNYVIDYTDLRCKPNPNCWYSVFDTTTYGMNVSEQCNNNNNNKSNNNEESSNSTPNNRGIFVHTKNIYLAKTLRSYNTTPVDVSLFDPDQPLFQSTYKQCQP